MLVLSRKKDDRIVIGDSIVVTVVDVRGDSVKLGIEAPREVKIYRAELIDAIERANIEAAQPGLFDLKELEKKVKGKGSGEK